MKRTWFAAAVAFLVSSSLSAALLQNAPQAPVPSANEETAFLCPMHPDYTLDVSGKCPRCGMALVRAAAYDVRDYRLDFQTMSQDLWLLDAVTFEAKRLCEGDQFLDGVALHPDGKRVALAYREQKAILFDLDSGRKTPLVGDGGLRLGPQQCRDPRPRRRADRVLPSPGRADRVVR